MVTYSENEMIGITELGRTLNSVVDSVANHKVEKIAIFKSNKPKVVLVAFDEYQRIKAAADLMEYHEIADIVDERLTNSKPEDFISMNELMARMKKRGIDV